MNINDIIYFSPNVKMESLDFDNKEQVLSAFYDRVTNYYFAPIKQLNSLRHAFAAGLILVSLIDAFSRYSTGIKGSEARMTKWIVDNLKHVRFSSRKTKEEIATAIYKDFRCGLVHESHIKNGGQFSYLISGSVVYDEGFVIINPERLFEELNHFFKKYIEQLNNNEALYLTFMERFRSDFEEECRQFRKVYNKDNRDVS